MRDPFGVLRRVSMRALPTFLVVLGSLVLPGCTGTLSSGGSPAAVGQVAQVGSVATVAKEGAATTVAAAATAAPTGTTVQTQVAGAGKARPASLASVQVPEGGGVAITLGDSITVGGSGATVEGNTIHITAAGTYTITGTLDNGQIVVDTDDEETVTLVLNGADITSSASAPIYVKDVATTVIVLADGTENHVTDGSSYQLEDPSTEEPDATIFSKGNLAIVGNGFLTVDANYNDAIASKDALEIAAGHITIDSVSDGVRGRDYVVIRGGEISVTAAGDGLKATNDEDPAKGFVAVEGGTINLSACEDGIQAETSVLVSGGELAITSGGGSAQAPAPVPASPMAGGATTTTSTADQASAKGIKALTDVTIEGGTITIDSKEDAVHSNGSLRIGGGQVSLTSGDDGIHADATIQIDGGEIAITRSYESIESAVITINNGNIHLVSSDDGINVSGGNDGSALGGRPGQNSFNSSSPYHLHVNGGYTVVDSVGDGIDANGAVDMSGGVVVVNGPTANMNGALDYDRGFKITGGTLVAVGSSGMAQAPDTSSTQCSVLVNLPASQPAGAAVHFQTQAGEELLTFVPTKAYQSIVVSSPALRNGSAYLVHTGGTSTGTVTDGLYSNGAYSGGTQAASVTISGVVTTVGSASRGGFPGGRL